MMGWTRLTNPKESRSRLSRDLVRVGAVRAGPSRIVSITLGSSLAQRGGFTKSEHKCHLLVGSGEDAGNVAISLDDTLGKFKAARSRRYPDGRYRITIPSAAAAGRFNLNFATFDRPATVTGGAGSPSFIAFAVPSELLARAAA